MNVSSRTHQSGLSIIEMMVSITIGLIILAGLASILVNNSRARTEIERSNRQIENGRYALQLLSDDLRLAGYDAEFDVSAMTVPATLPDPCSTSVADLQAALPVYVQGIDNVTAATVPSCLSDVKLGTDILVIRRTSTCTAGVGTCDAVVTNGTPYFQASSCGQAELSTPILNNPGDFAGHYYALSTDVTTLTLHKHDCTTTADIHRYFTHIYFIANNNKPGDGTPTLKLAELGGSSTNVTAFSIVPLVDGIEDLQFQYGVDLPTVDGIPDYQTSVPAGANAALGVLAKDSNWASVVSGSINLLARNTEATVGYSSAKTYQLGYNAAGAPIIDGPFADNYKRHAYQTAVRINNAAGRKTP